MQDRFKFRFWNTVDKKMQNLNGSLLAQAFNNEKLIPMQSTGLKDKHGKLIYEGDLLQQPSLPHIVQCEWFKGGFWLNGWANGASRELEQMHSCYEVIGNIFENPELLKEQK